MSIATEVKTKLKSNHRIVFITDADDLLAAWQFQRKSSNKRSKNLSAVPTEWRYSAPPDEKSPVMPVHASLHRKGGQYFSTVKPAREYSTIDCHGHGRRLNISVPDLNALDSIGFAKRNIAPYVSPILDTGTLALVCKDLGINGKAIPKIINGRQYIAFSGYPGLRSRFPGTIYSAKNQRIIKMAIGTLGIRRMVKIGGIITFCITVPLTILECFLSDPTTLSELTGNIASEIIKIGVSAVMGYIAGIIFGGFIAYAFAPIGVAIGIGVITTFSLEYLDDKFQMTKKLIAVLEDLSIQMGKTTENIAFTTRRNLYHGFWYFLRSSGVRGRIYN